MTTFTLSELGCSGDCQQGRYPCTCQRGVAIETKLEPDVYHIPFSFLWYLRFVKGK